MFWTSRSNKKTSERPRQRRLRHEALQKPHKGSAKIHRPVPGFSVYDSTIWDSSLDILDHKFQYRYHWFISLSVYYISGSLFVASRPTNFEFIVSIFFYSIYAFRQFCDGKAQGFPWLEKDWTRATLDYTVYTISPGNLAERMKSITDTLGELLAASKLWHVKLDLGDRSF